MDVLVPVETLLTEAPFGVRTKVCVESRDARAESSGFAIHSNAWVGWNEILWGTKEDSRRVADSMPIRSRPVRVLKKSRRQPSQHDTSALLSSGFRHGSVPIVRHRAAGSFR
mgnify:CR=1 FL=1